jgi:hypothetical protein
MRVKTHINMPYASVLVITALGLACWLALFGSMGLLRL